MIKPYFETALGKLYNANCESILGQMGDNSVDLVLTDPPYGIGADKMQMGTGQHKWDKSINNWDNNIPNENIFKEIDRISRNYIIWGGNYFTNVLKPTEHWIVWDKLNPNMSFSEAEFAYVKNGKKIRIYKEYSANQDKYHPTQKPVKLFNYCVINYSNEKSTILDCYAGAGTIGISCEQLQRKWIGIEISEKYCEIAARRIEQEARQGKFEL